jgi:PKD repeat protein
MRRQRLILAAVVLALVIGSATIPGAAFAAPPANDNFAGAVIIDPAASSFTDTVTPLYDATTEFNEPQYCNYSPHTVWYAVTPSSNELIRLSVNGSSFFDTNLRVYRQDSSGLGGLAFVTCAYAGPTTFEAQAGTTYYIQAGDVWSNGVNLQFSFEVLPPPPNDDFANAAAVGAVPYSNTVDTSAATIQAGEPTPTCGYGQSAGTAWYAFTPSVSGSYSASAQYPAQVAAYTGSNFGNLTQIACQTFGSLLTFHVDAGHTVYLQMGGIFGNRGNLMLNLAVAPDPVVNLNYYIGDPSIFDTVQFSDSSYDPGNVGIQSRSWDFGDGTGSTEQSPTHRFAEDNTYTVTLTVTTPDGRSKSLSRDVIVKTHDVSVAKVGVPQTGNVGQTRQISVGVVNTRYDDNVQVVLLKSVAGGGWQQVGALTQWVPVRGANRTTNFAFSYTFAPEDAVLGKITFQAVAYVQGARDAIPTDNTYISLLTKVNG